MAHCAVDGARFFRRGSGLGGERLSQLVKYFSLFQPLIPSPLSESRVCAFKTSSSSGQVHPTDRVEIVFQSKVVTLPLAQVSKALKP